MIFKAGKKSTKLEKALTKSNECTKFVLAAKEKYINKFIRKPNNLKIAPKEYWKILNCIAI